MNPRGGEGAEASGAEASGGEDSDAFSRPSSSALAASDRRSNRRSPALFRGALPRRDATPSLLTAAEVEWIDAYHARVWDRVSPRLEPDSEGGQWLRQATRPLAEHALASSHAVGTAQPGGASALPAE